MTELILYTTEDGRSQIKLQANALVNALKNRSKK